MESVASGTVEKPRGSMECYSINSPMEVILRYIRNVSSLKKIELKNHKNRTENKKVVYFFIKLFLS